MNLLTAIIGRGESLADSSHSDELAPLPVGVTTARELLTQPVLLPVFGKKLSTYQLARDYTVDVFEVTITVPAGLITDGASVPWFAWSLGFLPDGPHRAGALVHDWLYSLQGLCEEWACSNYPKLGLAGHFVDEGFSRKECDDIFLDLMLRAGVDKSRARIMWMAVRACGWWPWRNAKGPEIREPFYEIT